MVNTMYVGQKVRLLTGQVADKIYLLNRFNLPWQHVNHRLRKIVNYSDTNPMSVFVRTLQLIYIFDRHDAVRMRNC